MSNALLFARLLTEQATSKPTEATEAPGEGNPSQHDSMTAPQAKQEAISGNEQLKLEYNQLLARELKAEEYLSGPDRTLEEVEKWLPKFNQVCMDLSSILDQIGTYTHREAVTGFMARN